ncbi:MAG: TIGR02206 family membrane protein [Spirochaetales bacterium]|nr:TIGR02206 family membrane protein [Spirochaetales bacterium]
MRDIVRLVLAGVIIANYAATQIYRVAHGEWSVQLDLPMQFCHWAMAVAVVALLTGKQTAIELTFFWVLTGIVQGLISPDTSFRPPHPEFFFFFIWHVAVMTVPFYLPSLLDGALRRRSSLRAWLWGQIYFACAIAANALVGGNYGYLMEKPAPGSLMDLFGPWPYYWLTIQLVAVALFFLLEISYRFTVSRRRPVRRAGSVENRDVSI